MVQLALDRLPLVRDQFSEVHVLLDVTQLPGDKTGLRFLFLLEITSRSDSVWRRSPPAAGKAQTCWTAPGIQFQSASVAEDDDYDDDEEDDLEASVNEGELFFQPACRLLLAGLSVRVHLNNDEDVDDDTSPTG